MARVVALTGSPFPPARVAVASGHTESRILYVTDLRRAGTVAEALDPIPPVLPNRSGEITVLTETTDYLGGPILATQAAEIAARPVTHNGRTRARTWTILPLQTAPGDRIGDTEWKADVSRRVILAALVSLGLAGRLKIRPSLQLAAAFQDGLASLRQRRTMEEEELNPNEDIALAVALCAWYVAVTV